MKLFLGEDFLLSTPTARQLYHDAARDMPIYEYYSRLATNLVAGDEEVQNLSHLLLSHDHHAWRAMQTAGVPEELIRGNGDDWEKFLAYAKVLQSAIGNPLFHLTHMTLNRLFGITETLNEGSARAIWDHCNERLKSPDMRAQSLLARYRVQSVCINEEPLSELTSYRRAQTSQTRIKLYPIFFPGRFLSPTQSGFADSVARLGDLTGGSIRSVADLITALEKRMDYFHAHGCRAADHSLDSLPSFVPDEERAERAFRAALGGNPIKGKQLASYLSLMQLRLGLLYAKRGWVQHYHISALRDTNQRMYALYGGDTGFDALNDAPIAQNLSRLLDAQDRSMSLPKTVLYSANPSQNAALIALMGSHQQAGVSGKMQMGAPWRFQNHRGGIEMHLKSLASMSLLNHSIGMTAGGAAIGSFSRHEYFRRILCDTIGNWVEAGEFPADIPLLKAMVRAIAYQNAAGFFDSV